jgi:hypothetical protein
MGDCLRCSCFDICVIRIAVDELVEKVRNVTRSKTISDVSAKDLYTLYGARCKKFDLVTEIDF